MQDNVELPPDVTRALDGFVESARAALGDQLLSAVLFGSAAQGRLRASSDVNLILVLSRFDAARANGLRDALRIAHAAIGLEVMLIQVDEIEAACDAFAVKLADIESRHRVLFGMDPFARLPISREAMIRRVRQVLLNLTLRLRNRYVTASLREEQAARIAADVAGPLRAAAGALLRIEGRTVPSPKEALEMIAAELGDEWTAVLARLSQARERGRLPQGDASQLLLQLIELAHRLAERARSLY